MCLTLIKNKEQLLETFISQADDELSLRKKELVKLKNIITSTENINDKFSIMRYTYPSIYSHYEGFLKSLFNNLINFLTNMNLNYYDLNPKLVLMTIIPSLENHLSKQSKKADALLNIFNHVIDNNENIFNFMLKDKYIVNHDTLKSTLELLDIDPNNINIGDLNNIVFPLEQLGIIYGRRNGIAHGELNQHDFNIFDINNSSKELNQKRIEVAQKFWMDNYDETINALNLLKDIFYNYINEKKYLKNTNVYVDESLLEDIALGCT